jgi:hypothetical protein
MPARNPHAVRQRTIAAARRRSGRPAGHPSLDPVFVALNPGALPAREWPAPSCMRGAPRRGVRHLGANMVVELNSESRARHPTTRAWAITRRADRTSRLHEPQERERGGRCSLTP